MLLKINPTHPEDRKISRIVEVLEGGGVIIYPTDSVYAFGCDITKSRAIERICRLRGLNPAKANLTFICKDISQITDYSSQIDNRIFRMLKKHLPGPFTFILKANNKVPKLLKNNKKTIGVRVQDNPIALAILEKLDRPILSISLKSEDKIAEYLTDPVDFYENFKKRVDAVIDGGIGNNVPTTIVNCISGIPEVTREGAGVLEE